MSIRLVPKFNNTRERDAFWLQVCQEFISSGLSKVAFCDKRKISDSSLYRWLGNFKDKLDFNQPDTQLNLPQKVKKSPIGKKLSAKHGFMSVNIEQQASTKKSDLAGPLKSTLPAAELVFPNGLKLIIHQTINVELLSHLIQAMG